VLISYLEAVVCVGVVASGDIAGPGCPLGHHRCMVDLSPEAVLATVMEGVPGAGGSPPLRLL